jgi:hypothetical protein
MLKQQEKKIIVLKNVFVTLLYKNRELTIRANILEYN